MSHHEDPVEEVFTFTDNDSLRKVKQRLKEQSMKVETKEMLSKQREKMKEILSKQADKIAEEHERFINKRTVARLFVREVLKIIQEAKQGLLLVSSTHSEDEIWAALLLAKHLKWPVVADILSGLRLRKVLSSFPEADEKVLFVDHLDHALISDSVKDCINFDVIIQASANALLLESRNYKANTSQLVFLFS